MPPLKDILGKPGEGIHFHVFGVAIMDVIMTIALGCLIGWMAWRHNSATNVHLSMVVFTVLLFAVGELLHAVIGVDTAVVLWIRGKKRGG